MHKSKVEEVERLIQILNEAMTEVDVFKDDVAAMDLPELRSVAFYLEQAKARLADARMICQCAVETADA
jgi:hypothetical protein